MAENNAEEFVTVRQAAKIRGVSRYAIYDLIRRGRLKTTKRYGLTLVSRAEVENFEPAPKRKKEDKN